MKNLFDLNPSDCRYVVSTGPSLFCAEVKVDGSSYCRAHHKACHTGSFGKDWQALAGMMSAMEQTIQPTAGFTRERPETAGIDIEIRGGK